MDPSTKQIIIKLDIPEKAARYYEQHSKWEDEGGATMGTDRFPFDVPFEKGDLLRVISAVVDVRDGEVFYIADVEVEKV